MQRRAPVLFPESPLIAYALFQDDFDSTRSMNFPGIGGRVQDGFQLPVPFPFPHPAAAFLPPMAPQPAAPSSGSSHSSEGSASSQHTWSFEEQFKQVRQVGRLALDGVCVCGGFGRCEIGGDCGDVADCLGVRRAPLCCSF